MTDVSTRVDAGAALIRPLTRLSRSNLAVAGGKGANLGELVGAGFAVPPGFVVTTDAYTQAITDAGVPAQRSAIAATKIPPDVRDAVLAAYTELGEGPVAVRSSATAEDLPGAAFAGQQDTYLNVVGRAALLDAVRDCWASLWTERAIAYRDARDVDPAGIAIAVVVQRMVPAEFAGVMFTANPVSGERGELVIDAGAGLGEAVVSGLVTPDHYVLDAEGAITERRAGRREVVITGAAGGGVTQTAGGELTHLPDEVIGQLAATGRAVAAHFGRPQDIEWAVADGRVWLVQARPMTALPPQPIRLSRVQRLTGPQVLELLPIRPYPMDMSAWLLPGPGTMVGRMMSGIPGLRIDFSDVLPEVDGVVDRYLPPTPRPTAAVFSAPVRLLRKARRFRPAGWTSDPRFTRFHSTIADLAALDPADLDWPRLRTLPRQALDAMGAIAELRVDYLPRVGFDLARRALVLTLLGRRTLSADLAVGTRTRTEDANDALAALAAMVTADPRLRTALADADQVPDGFPEFAAAVAAFRVEYGHRETVSPVLMSAPSWGESPGTILDIVRLLAEGSSTPEQPDRGGRALRALLAHPLVRLTGAQRRITTVVEAARAGVAFREDTHFYGTAALPVVRRAVLEMGARLAAAGALKDPQDVLHLRLEELEALAEPTAETARLRTLVRERAARRAELEGVPLIATSALFPHPVDPGDALLTGAPASGGRVRGPVRVVMGPAQFGVLRSGDVLVCPYTNPSWTPLFQRAAAVVVDTGGAGSHAAIIAREYGMPAVMGTGTGTSVLTDGQDVTVDGDTGRIMG